MEDQFRFSRIAVTWLAVVAVCAAVFAWIFEPGYWLVGVGIGLTVLAVVFGNLRTGTRYSWDPPYALTWFEGLCALSGVALAIPPLLIAVVRGLR